MQSAHDTRGVGGVTGRCKKMDERNGRAGVQGDFLQPQKPAVQNRPAEQLHPAQAINTAITIKRPIRRAFTFLKRSLTLSMLVHLNNGQQIKWRFRSRRSVDGSVNNSERRGGRASERAAAKLEGGVRGLAVRRPPLPRLAHGQWHGGTGPGAESRLADRDPRTLPPLLPRSSPNTSQ